METLLVVWSRILMAMRRQRGCNYPKYDVLAYIAVEAIVHGLACGACNFPAVF
jgi:hypothetical protein